MSWNLQRHAGANGIGGWKRKRHSAPQDTDGLCQTPAGTIAIKFEMIDGSPSSLPLWDMRPSSPERTHGTTAHLFDLPPVVDSGSPALSSAVDKVICPAGSYRGPGPDLIQRLLKRQWVFLTRGHWRRRWPLKDQSAAPGPPTDGHPLSHSHYRPAGVVRLARKTRPGPITLSTTAASRTPQPLGSSPVVGRHATPLGVEGVSLKFPAPSSKLARFAKATHPWH